MGHMVRTTFVLPAVMTVSPQALFVRAILPEMDQAATVVTIMSFGGVSLADACTRQRGVID